ncbi:ribosome biogenesis protein Nop53/GLTSCR2 [Syncephalis fuscata]|nr:ribosome biogenesis protein Nop53/GLTSCR2 [Syncephalis fuscata]
MVEKKNSSAEEQLKDLTLLTEETKKKKQGSRKGKKNWRKNIDIADVEEGLAELVTEEIEGGKLHERKNEDLFTVDVAGDEKVERKLKKEKKKLRVDQILEKRSHVPAPIERVVLKESVVSEIETTRINDLAKRIKSGDVKRSTRGVRKRARTQAEKERIAGFDLWTDSGSLKAVEKKPELVDPTAISTPVATQMPATIGRNRIEMEAVKISHPGASYRPTENEHSALMTERQEAIQRHSKAEKAIDAKLSYPANGMTKRKWKAMSNIEEEEEEVQDNDGTETNKQKEAKRKTKVQRNREKRQREMEMQAAESRKKKHITKQLGRLHEIKRTVEMEEAARAERTEERKKQRELEAVQPKKKIGRRSVPQPLVQVQKVEDLTDSLRRLKTEGNLLRDRYQSLLERNVIEPRVRVGQRRKYKRKTYEKPSFRRFV